MCTFKCLHVTLTVHSDLYMSIKCCQGEMGGGSPVQKSFEQENSLAEKDI